MSPATVSIRFAARNIRPIMIKYNGRSPFAVGCNVVYVFVRMRRRIIPHLQAY